MSMKGKIVWNKVTPFSKAVALALFIAMPFIGFWYGIQYGRAFQLIQDQNTGKGAPNVNASAGSTPFPSYGYYEDVLSWQTDSNNPGFSIAYPLDFDTQDAYKPAPSPSWRTGSAPGETGITLFTLTIPRALEPQTNFADAKLTVGEGTNAAAAANCLEAGISEGGGPQGASTSSETIDGVQFAVLHTTGAGAGNLYDITSYSALHGGKCWNIEYTVHSTQIGNYPPSYGLRPFEEAYVAGILERIAQTFKFGK